MAHHRIVNIFSRAVGGMRRKPWLHLLSLITLTAAFLSFAATLTAAINLDNLISKWIGGAEITVFLMEGTDTGDIDRLAEAVAKIEGVAKVDKVTSEEELIGLKKDLGDIAEALPKTAFPASLDVHLDEVASRNPEARKALASRLEKLEVIESVELYDEWFERLSALSFLGRAAAFGLGLVSLAVAILVVAAVIKSGINARKKEIEVLDLIGATRAYILAPYLLEGAFEALLAMLIALFGLHLITNAVAKLAGDFVFLIGPNGFTRLPGSVVLILISGSIMLGIIGARMSLKGICRAS